MYGRHRIPGTRIVAAFVFLAAVPIALAAGSIRVKPSEALGGTYSLEVSLDTDCVEPPTVTLVPPPSTVTGTFRACDTISAEAVTVIAPGASFRTGNEVALGEGFRVDAGVDFEAFEDISLSGPFAWVRDDSPALESAYKARFFIWMESLSLAPSDLMEHFTGYSSDQRELFQVFLEKDSGTGAHVLTLAARLDDGTTVDSSSSKIALTPGWNRITLDWRAGDGDGHFLVKVNDSPGFSGLTALGNADRRVDFVRWGAVGGSLAASSGTLDLDIFRSWR